MDTRFHGYDELTGLAVEQVIAKVTALSVELGANPTVTEQVYRAMITGFINAELAEHEALQGNG